MGVRITQSQPHSTVATAHGKAILFGEHAVVYGQPAIAVPVTNVEARATITASERGTGIHVAAADLPSFDGSPGGRLYRLRDALDDDPLRAIIDLALTAFFRRESTGPKSNDLVMEPDLLISVTSTIPIARGLGSGAGVATAVARSIARHYGQSPGPGEISRLVYEVEKLHHGTPSGIDNSVIAYEQPIYFVRGEGITPLSMGGPLSLVIADTGVVSSTRDVVSDVRRRWQAETKRYEDMFKEVGAIVRLARSAIEHGDSRAVGRLMNKNHELLITIGVSSPELNTLVEAAQKAGALGAKLSGAGWGGNMVTLVEPDRAPIVAKALHDAGAVSTIFSQIS